MIVYHFANNLCDILEFLFMDALERSKRYIEAISIIMQEEGMTKDADLASIVGVERSIIPKVRTGRQYASIELIVKTYIAYPRINTDYILTGRGSMFIQEQESYDSAINEQNEELIEKLQSELKEAYTEIGRLNMELNKLKAI